MWMRRSSQKLEHQSVSICVLYISGAGHARPQMTAVSQVSIFLLELWMTEGWSSEKILIQRLSCRFPPFCLTRFGFDDPVLEITDELMLSLMNTFIYFFHLDYFSFVLHLRTVNQWLKRRPWSVDEESFNLLFPFFNAVTHQHFQTDTLQTVSISAPF